MSDTSPANKPSRRLFLAAGSAGAVFGALGATVAAEAQGAVALAMERHKAAWDIWWAAEDDDALNAANGPANRALWNLAGTPCATDAEFFAKLRHMLACHDRLNQEDADTTECPEILAAIRLHLEARA